MGRWVGRQSLTVIINKLQGSGNNGYRNYVEIWNLGMIEYKISVENL